MDFMPKLINMCEFDESDIRKEVAWAVSNAASGGDPEKVRKMVE